MAHDATLPRANSLASMSLASTLLDRRIPEMTIKVYRVRRLCQDALVGIAHVPISTTELAGTSRDHSIYLENGCASTLRKMHGTPLRWHDHGAMQLQLLRGGPPQPPERVGLSQTPLLGEIRPGLGAFFMAFLSALQALAQLLQGEDGLEVLSRALPPQIHGTAENSEGMAVMQSFLVSLCNQVSMLSEDESDAEVMQRLAPLSRSIQDFIASCLRPTRRSNTYAYCIYITYVNAQV